MNILYFYNETEKIEKSECITSKKFHFNFKQKLGQVLQNNAEYKDAIKYSTRDDRIRDKFANDCYLLDIVKLAKHFNAGAPP